MVEFKRKLKFRLNIFTKNILNHNCAFSRIAAFNGNGNLFTVPKDLEVKMKAVLLGATFLIVSIENLILILCKKFNSKV